MGLFFELSSSFGDTYGPLAGTVALLLWALLSSVGRALRRGTVRYVRRAGVAYLSMAQQAVSVRSRGGAQHRASGSGDHARQLARDTRVWLACEHIGLLEGEADAVVDPRAWFDEIQIRVDALDAWHAAGQVGPRPPGHLRRRRTERVTETRRRLLHWMHAHVLDPDGRPSELERRDEY